jgi:hypothetical protein
MTKTVFSCYTPEFIGWFKSDNVGEVRRKIKLYNQSHKEKIVRFKTHRPLKVYEV